MTTTYDPHHAAYLDEADVRGELTRAFDLCHGCRRCVALCEAFPTLFDLVDGFDEDDAGNLTPDEQDRIVDACVHCKLCALDCPYGADVHEANLDLPRLMIRAEAMRVTNGHTSIRRKVTTRLVARTSVFGRPGRLLAELVDRTISVVAAEPRRATIAATFGEPAPDRLPPRRRPRLSSWMRRRSHPADATRRVAVYPSCLIEHRDAGVGRDLVEVYERNRIVCDVVAVGCCGAPWLHNGHLAQFARVANDNVRALAARISDGVDGVVVAEPTCAWVLRRAYLDHVDDAHREEAELVAERIYDAAEYLMRAHADGRLDTGFGDGVPAHVTYRPADHLRAQQIGFPACELLELVGAEVRVDGPRPRDGETGGAVAGDGTLANARVEERTGVAPSHPISLVARAYGIDPA